MKGILKSRPSTPAVSDSGTSVGEKSKKLADKALNILNPARKYQKRRKELFKALAWWEDEEQNPESISSRRKIIFEDRFRRRRASLESSIRSSSKSNTRCQSQTDAEFPTGEVTRVLPSRLMRKWKKVGRVLNIANTLAKMKAHDRLANFPPLHYFTEIIVKPCPQTLSPKTPRPNPNQVLIISKTNRDWG